MAWEADFNAGAAGFVTADEMLFAFQAIGATVILLWVVWIFITSYQAWGLGEIKASQMMFLWARAVLVLSILLYLFVN